jgi:acyl-CoA synthetase (AMP-forming)/AMP-acid ligase II
MTTLARHDVIGAGVDRRLHAPFEERFGFPLIEAWAMTETGAGAVVIAHEEPRHIGANCFGRPAPEVETLILRDDGTRAGIDEPGELLVRHAGADPRFGFFRDYLKDPEATAAAWEGGWFHTGDVVRQGADGSMYFVDRKKNVIRRSGENISAVEVESVLAQHPLVRQVAVAATPDSVRGDEVVALIVPHEAGVGTREAADELVQWCLTRLAYYKAPGWVAFVEALPLTGTQKIQRGALKDLVGEIMAQQRSFDTRALKKRAP